MKKQLPMKNHSNKSNTVSTRENTVKKNTVSVISCFDAVLGILFSLTFFLPGEQAERSGLFHLPCILWLLTALVWIVLPLLKKGCLPEIRFSRIDLLVYGFFAAVCISAVWNILPGHGGAPRSGLNMLSVWLGLTAAWFLFRQLLHEQRIVTTFFGIVLAVIFSETLLGFHQQFIGIPDMLRQFESAPEQTIAQIDSSIKPGTPDWDRLVARLKTAKPMGTYPMTNSLGGLLGCWFIFLVGFLVLFFPQTLRQRMGAVTITGLIFVCFILTQCRSGLIAVGVGMMLLAFLLIHRHWGNKLLFILLFVGLAAAALFIVTVFVSSGKSLISGASRSLGFRLEYWQSSLGMIRDYPILGCGSGNFKQNYMQYKLPQSSEEISDPHNFAVEIAAVSGLPAFLLFVVPFGFLLCNGFRTISVPAQNNNSPPRSEVFTFYGGLVGCWLAFVLSFNGEAGMDFLAPVFAVIAFPIVAFIFKRSDNTIIIPASLISITLIVFFVHLSAAGGISATSTVISLWFSAAVLVNRQNNIETKYRFLRIGIAVFLIAAIIFVQQMSYQPVLRAGSLLIQAEEEKEELRRIALLRQAVQADSWSSVIRERLAMETFRLWLIFPNDKMRKTETLEIQRQAIRLMPRSATLHFIFAERLNLMYEKNGDAELAETALEYYRNAVLLYPNAAKFRAPYALFLWKTAGNSDEKRKEALRQRNLAIQLDDLMPHADQKLTPEQRLLLLNLPANFEDISILLAVIILML
ncbi:MAG: O-antigen ligase family protein [Planctomycetaceae bacterium]|jgi:O-antigen ligase|nr:O-antigen ligase family protein [Planctomycetaceae bacterium]